MQITNVPFNALKSPSWGATTLLRPEKNLLKLSLLESGWLQPIVVKSDDMTIIDGYHRWLIAQDDEKFIKKHGTLIPVIFHDVDDIDAMVIHVRLNRARGTQNVYALSKIVKKIVASSKYTEVDLGNILLMHDDEIDILLSSGLLKKKDWAKYDYSRAWVPIEVPAGTDVGSTVIERPPNKDR